jgi:hypothetical protein
VNALTVPQAFPEQGVTCRHRIGRIDQNAVVETNKSLLAISHQPTEFLIRGDDNAVESKPYTQPRRIANGGIPAAGQGGREIWIQGSYNPILDPVGQLLKVVK